MDGARALAPAAGIGETARRKDGAGRRLTIIEVTQTRIARPELSGRLNDALARGSLILLADAGFGKTTALEQSLQGLGTPAVWLTVTRGDRDPGRLVARLVEAVRLELPGFAEEYAERIATAVEPLDVDALARSLADDLERLLVEPLVIAIDEAEHLEGSDALSIVDALIGGSRELLRVALCSRRALGLKLARPKAAGRVAELGPADLAFSPAECEACLRVVRGQEPAGDEVEMLFAATEGWPLGMALAAAAGPGAEQLPARGREAIFAYLAEEVFDGLDPVQRQQLVEASVVDQLEPLLEEALGLPESFRSEVERIGVFVRPLGDSYGFHPLLRDFLRARLIEERGPEQVRELHQRVAGALAAQGRAPDAIEHWLAGEDFEAAADAIAANGIPLAATAPETVARWLRQLPEAFRDRPVLRLLAGRVAIGEGDFDAGVEHCRAGVAGLERERAPQPLLWAARLALTDAYIAALDLEAAVAASDGADDAGAEAGPAAIFCRLLHAALLARLGAAGSDRALETALGEPTARELLGPALDAFRAQYLELPAGELDAALEHIDRGIAALEAQDPYGRLAYVLAFKMAIHEARGELELALDAFDHLLEAAQRTGLAGFIGAGARLSAATMLALLDRPEEARVQLERVDRHWSSWVGCDQHAARALLAGREGDRSVALSEGGLALEEAKRMPAFDRVRPVAVLAPVLCEAGEPGAAEEALRGVLDALGPGESRARARAALACVLQGSGEREAGHRELAAALAEAGQGARFILRSEWPHVEAVLWSALEAGAVDPEIAIGALAAAFPGGPELAGFADHPMPAVRDATLAAAASAGHPDALARLAQVDSAQEWAGGSGVESLRDRLRRHPPPLVFRTLGRFEIRRSAYAIEAGAWERKVSERVVRLLLIRDGELVPEDELLEALWADKPQGSGRRGLQTAISSARAVLDLPWEQSRLRVTDRSYALTLHEGDRLDAKAFEAAARRALSASGQERIGALDAAAALWTGEPLPEERYSDWAASWRERLSSLYADLLGSVAEAHGGAGDHAAAVRAARALVDLDPLDEHAQRLLMGAYASAGRRGQALRQFLECRRALVEELGIEPEAETLALQRRILAGT